MPRANEAGKKILIIKLGAIGDVITSLTMLEAAGRQYPGANISWVCGRTVAPLLKLVPGVNELIILDDGKLLKGSLGERLRVIFYCWKRLFLRKFDLVVIPNRDSRYKLLVLTCRKKMLRTISGKDRFNRFIPGRYFASENARLIDGVDDWQMKTARVPLLNPPESPMIDESLKAIDKPVVVLAPGGARNLLADDALRRWPAESYQFLASRLIGENRVKVVLVGAECDAWVSEFFSGMDVLNLIGKTSLTELLYLFKKSSLLVSHDTGVLHMGKLIPLKTIALLGPSLPKQLTGPGENISVIWGGKDLPCAPCFDGRHFARCDNNICLKNIQVDEVLKLIHENLPPAEK